MSTAVKCDVYWGSHGCEKPQGHNGACECDCCPCALYGGHDEQSMSVRGCVAKPPYYGPETRFYGADVATRGLPEVELFQ